MLFKKINDSNLKVNVKIIDDLQKLMENQDMKDTAKLNKVNNIVNRMVDAFKDSQGKREKKLSDYQKFMKQNYATFRKQLSSDQPGTDPDPKDVMKYGAARWKETTKK